MKEAEIKIRGRKPILFHKFNIEVLTDSKKPKEGSAGNNPNEWKDTVFCDANKIYVPDSYFFSTFVAGGKYVKVGRGTIAKNMAGILEISRPKSYFLNRELPKALEEVTIEDVGTDSSRDVYVDCRMVSNPNTKGRNVRYRLAIKTGWELDTEIRWDDSVISKSQIEQAITHAGNFVGLADGRTIGFGRFDVLEFNVL